VGSETRDLMPSSTQDNTAIEIYNIKGISIEEGKRRDTEFLTKVQNKNNEKRRKEMIKSMFLWFIFYNIVGLLVLNYFRPNSIENRLYYMGIGICATSAAMIYATTITGLGKIAVPHAMVVADSNLGVMKDMQAAKDRVFSSLGGPLQGFVYGAVLLVLSGFQS
jgi:phosphate starvation-inducible membrane PsiE